jgi:hypothetical protein
LSNLRDQRDGYLRTGYSTSHSAHVRSTLKIYTAFCDSQGLLAFPCSFDSVSLFVVHHCMERNDGSAKSVDNVVSALSTYSRLRGHSWLNPTEALRLRQVVARLKYLDSSPSHRKLPVGLDLLLDIAAGPLQGLLNPYYAYLYLCFALAHDGLLRLGELTSDLTVRDFLWAPDRSTVRLLLRRSKRNRAGPGELVTIAAYDCPHCAVNLLRWWFDLNGLWSRPDSVVLPRLRGVPGAPHRPGALDPLLSPPSSIALDWTISVTSDFLRRAIKACVSNLGLDSSLYSGHSFRGGGATDLFNARVPYLVIKRMGRWKSDVALIYWRDEADVAHACSRAFGSVRETWHRQQQRRLGGDFCSAKFSFACEASALAV